MGRLWRRLKLAKASTKSMRSRVIRPKRWKRRILHKGRLPIRWKKGAKAREKASSISQQGRTSARYGTQIRDQSQRALRKCREVSVSPLRASKTHLTRHKSATTSQDAIKEEAWLILAGSKTHKCMLNGIGQSLMLKKEERCLRKERHKLKT